MALDCVHEIDQSLESKYHYSASEQNIQKKAERLLAEMVPGEPESAARPLDLIVAKIAAEISPHGLGG